MASKAIKDFNREFNPMDQYLNELATTDLFEGSEEIKAFESFEKAKITLLMAQDEYKAVKGKLAKLNGDSTKEDHQEFNRLKRKVARWDQRYIEARNEIIKRNTRLVISVAKKYIGQGVDLGDLIGFGNLAMFNAVEKFDFRRGYKFSTYATWWIRQGVTRAIADTGRTIRLPVHMYDWVQRVNKAAYRYYQEHEEWPSPEQLAEYLNLETKEVEYYLEVGQYPISLEKSLNEDEEDGESEFIGHNVLARQEDNAHVLAELNQQKEALEKVLDTLTPREARILRLRFGLADGQSHTLEEVGQKFGITRERIRQIEAGALRKLRHPRRSRHLKEFLEV